MSNKNPYLDKRRSGSGEHTVFDGLCYWLAIGFSFLTIVLLLVGCGLAYQSEFYGDEIVASLFLLSSFSASFLSVFATWFLPKGFKSRVFLISHSIFFVWILFAIVASLYTTI